MTTDEVQIQLRRDIELLLPLFQVSVESMSQSQPITSVLAEVFSRASERVEQGNDSWVVKRRSERLVELHAEFVRPGGLPAYQRILVDRLLELRRRAEDAHAAEIEAMVSRNQSRDEASDAQREMERTRSRATTAENRLKRLNANHEVVEWELRSTRDELSATRARLWDVTALNFETQMSARRTLIRALVGTTVVVSGVWGFLGLVLFSRVLGAAQ